MSAITGGNLIRVTLGDISQLQLVASGGGLFRASAITSLTVTPMGFLRVVIARQFQTAQLSPQEASPRYGPFGSGTFAARFQP